MATRDQMIKLGHSKTTTSCTTSSCSSVLVNAAPIAEYVSYSSIFAEAAAWAHRQALGHPPPTHSGHAHLRCLARFVRTHGGSAAMPESLQLRGATPSDQEREGDIKAGHPRLTLDNIMV